jgi:hypothetical protein
MKMEGRQPKPTLTHDGATIWRRNLTGCVIAAVTKTAEELSTITVQEQPLAPLSKREAEVESGTTGTSRSLGDSI